MKKLIPALIAITLSLCAQFAFSQVKSDFSDWNVPPPIPPGTIPKGNVNSKQPLLQLPGDVPAPSIPFLANVRLPGLAPVLETALDVPAPEQPVFPELPFAVPDIPLPGIPEALAPPKPAPHDQIIEGITEMPEPAAPEMPPLPKIPDAKPGEQNTEELKLPIIPDIMEQPGLGSLPADAFPFTIWPAPAIPSNPYLIISQPVDLNSNKIKPGKNKKSVKKHNRVN